MTQTISKSTYSGLSGLITLNLILLFIHFITLCLNLSIYTTDDKVYSDGNYKKLYIVSLIMRFIWMVPVILIVISILKYYDMHSNRKCCEDMFETAIFGYILFNLIPNIVMDCANINEYRNNNLDMTVYEVQGPLTFLLMFLPLVCVITVITFMLTYAKYKSRRGYVITSNL
jgi:hypothetical protein